MAEIAVPAILAMLIIAFVGVGNELRERSDVIEVGLVRAWDLIRLVLYFMPTLISYIVAVTYMIGILMAFGALNQSNEFLAMKAAGIPLRQLVLPVILWGGVLSTACFLLQDRVQPWAWKQVNALLYEELPQRATLEVLPIGVMHNFGGVRIYIGGRDVETKTLFDIDIIQPMDDGKSKVFYAKSAQFVREGSEMKLILRDGHFFQPTSGDFYPRNIIDNMPFSLPSPTSLKAPSLRRTLHLNELFGLEKELETSYIEGKNGNVPVEEQAKRKTELLRSRLEIAERITLPLAALAVSFVAAPIAMRSQRGGRSYSFAIGFVIILAFYLLRSVLEPESLKSLSEILVRGFIPVILFSGIGMWAMWRVDRI
jgi:lipopolysaccharide export LptBFGC system permease protein LptF